MPDATRALLNRLRASRLPELDLGRERIHPAYQGLSILNVPATVCRWLGVPPQGAGPLDSDALGPLAGGRFRRVLWVLVDALSLSRFQAWMEAGEAPGWTELVADGQLAPLTSIVPSTTSAALTTLWTGRSAAAHGSLGYELWLKEYGVVANMIRHSAFTFGGDAGGLARAGFQPETFLPVPSLAPYFEDHGVAVHAYHPYTIARSGLSRMNLRGVDVQGYRDAADLWVSVRRLLEDHPRERMLIWVYWDGVDALSHLYGPEDERVSAAFAAFSRTFLDRFLEPLGDPARRDTLLLLMADHGQVLTPRDPHYDLRNHAGLTRRLHIQPTGENRLAYLFVRPGQTAAVREYIERTWPGQFQVLDSAYAAEAGLFGLGQRHPHLLDRVGDLIAIASGRAYWWWARKRNPILGRHGGLSEAEMIVPFLAASLNG